MNPIADSSFALPNSADKRPATVLVVEDDEMLRRLLSGILTREGYRVLSAESGPHALEISAAPANDSISFLIADLHLPGISGVALASELRATRPELKALFISGTTQERFSALGADMSQSAFIAKPFRMHEMIEAVKALAGRQPLSSSTSTAPSDSGIVARAESGRSLLCTVAEAA
jgi:two-component system, cell cycle sensor histidine kinase and response regulator CckA